MRIRDIIELANYNSSLICIHSRLACAAGGCFVAFLSPIDVEKCIRGDLLNAQSSGINIDSGSGIFEISETPYVVKNYSSLEKFNGHEAEFIFRQKKLIEIKIRKGLTTKNSSKRKWISIGKL